MSPFIPHSHPLHCGTQSLSSILCSVDVVTLVHSTHQPATRYTQSIFRTVGVSLSHSPIRSYCISIPSLYVPYLTHGRPLSPLSTHYRTLDTVRDDPYHIALHDSPHQETPNPVSERAYLSRPSRTRPYLNTITNRSDLGPSILSGVQGDHTDTRKKNNSSNTPLHRRIRFIIRFAPNNFLIHLHRRRSIAIRSLTHTTITTDEKNNRRGGSARLHCGGVLESIEHR